MMHHNARNTSSATRAKIAWLSPDGVIDPDFAEACREARLGISALKDERSADLAVADLRRRSITAPAARKLSNAARRAAPHGGVLFIASPDLDADRRRYLRRSGALVLTHDDPASFIEACRARLRRRNLAEEAGERLKSLAAAGALRPMDDEKKPHGQSRVLVAGKPSPTTLKALSTARSGGFYVEGVLTPVQALQAIETNQFDCAVFLPSAPSDPLRSLSAMVRRRSAQLDFPVITVAEDAINGEDIVFPAHVADDLPGKIADAVKHARQARMIRRVLRMDPQSSVTDRQTQAATASFFASHASRLLARAREADRMLSLIALSFHAGPIDAGGAAEIGPPLDHATSLINDVTRPEDMLSRIAPRTFVLTCPFTHADDAERIADRIAGVMQSTMFKTRDAGTSDDILFSMGAKTSVIDNWDDLPLEEMVAHLLSALNHDTIRPRLAPAPA